jgi:GNAT superfamily N-acetyltransferase
VSAKEKDMENRIRRALPDEVVVLSKIAFSAKAHWGYPEQWMEIWKPQLTFSPAYFEQNEHWVVDGGGDPIAFYTLLEKGKSAWIENMWVLPEYIGGGIGKRLFLHALTRSRLMGHLVLQLEADPNAVGFYEKMGMVQIGENNHPMEGQPRILPVMEIRLHQAVALRR